MAWMVASAQGKAAGDFGAFGKAEEVGPGCRGATGAATSASEKEAAPSTGSGCSDGKGSGGGDGGGDSSSAGVAVAAAGEACSVASPTSSPFSREAQGAAGTRATTAGPPAVMMILPPSYLYPIPNNAVAAKEGTLIGDGMESGVRERAGDFFAAESLAAHLWGRSWQGKDGKPWSKSLD